MRRERTMAQSAEVGVQKDRIAKNTVLLFVRMTLLMVVNLYAVRVLLDRLGDEGYGVFNAVAGMVSSLTCMTSVLAVSTQRFYSYVQGKGQHARIKEIFSASLNINVVLSLCVVILFETVGLWFLNNGMTISFDVIDSANVVFHYAVFTFVCAIIQIPFTAMIIANQRMGWVALISSFECLSRFVVALLIGTCSVDRLVFYSAGLFFVALVVLCVYVTLVIVSFPHCRYIIVKSKEAYKRLLSFSGWTLFGSLANVGLMQGNMILLNVFFGALANAAFAVSQQIYNAFNSLVSSVVLAIRPSMIRLYASGDEKTLFSLFNSSNKFICLIFLLVGLPLYLEMDYVLEIWIHPSNPSTVVYARMMVIYAFIVVLNNPITIMMQAVGAINEYHLKVESVTLLSMPVTGLRFWMGYPSQYMFIVMITLTAVAHVVRLTCLHSKFADYRVSSYITSILLPAIAIIAFVGMFIWMLHAFMDSSLLRLLLTALLSTVLLLLAYLTIGFDRRERLMAKELLFRRIKLR